MKPKPDRMHSRRLESFEQALGSHEGAWSSDGGNDEQREAQQLLCAEPPLERHDPEAPEVRSEIRVPGEKGHADGGPQAVRPA